MASNSRSKAYNGQNRKMFNNFLDSLDISGANQSLQGNGNGYAAARNKNNQSHGGKMSSNSTHAMRMVHNNTVQTNSSHGGVPSGPNGGKRNKQLVSSSFNMSSS